MSRKTQAKPKLAAALKRNMARRKAGKAVPGTKPAARSSVGREHS